MMLGGVKLLLLQAAVMVLVPVSDPRVDGQRRRALAPKCQQKIAECGEFQYPSCDGAKITRCRFNKKRCGFYCGFKCEKGPGGKRMKPSTNTKERYVCMKKEVRGQAIHEWTKLDAPVGYCKGHTRVKEVFQTFSNKSWCDHISEEKLNKLIGESMSAFYDYVAMASVYAGVHVALPGFTKLMVGLSEKDLNHSRELITYMEMRGFHFDPLPIPRPSAIEDMRTFGKRPAVEGLKRALNNTKDLTEFTRELIDIAKECLDPHLKHFLEDSMLEHQVNIQKKLADQIRRLETFVNQTPNGDTSDSDVGEYIMDLELRSNVESILSYQIPSKQEPSS